MNTITLAADRLENIDWSLLENPGTFFFHDADRDRDEKYIYLLTDPADVLVARSHDDVPDAMASIDRYLRRGKFLAGYIAYDAGLSSDKRIRSRHCAGLDLIWLGVYNNLFVAEKIANQPGETTGVPAVENLRFNVSEEEYVLNVRRAKEYIRAGDVYQINYTCKLRFDYSGSPVTLFAELLQKHPVPCSSYLDTGELQILSLSPELFLRREGKRVLTRPMKGTMRRGRWFAEDDALARRLSVDEKNRAENIMIVDLMRNDLGRVCEIGGVYPGGLYHVERYPSLFQMTSDIVGCLRDGISTSDLLRAAFPAGSITGAPKIRAMEIIDELEHEGRGVYCGTMGIFWPGGDCLLNVAIRTIVRRGKECEMGVGSGIVADSDASEEWSETCLKSHFLTAARPSFQLLETMLLKQDGAYLWLDEHVERMRKSALYFGWDFPEGRVRHELENTAREAQKNARVRLLLGRHGECKCEYSKIVTTWPEPVRVLLSSRKIDPRNVFLYHKTTMRDTYDKDLQLTRSEGYFDVIYLNTEGELTEGSITNIIVLIDGRWFTPPIQSGLLPGIWRAQCISTDGVVERTLTLDDLRSASRVVLGNSVRGAVEVDVIDQEGVNKPVWSRKKRPR